MYMFRHHDLCSGPQLVWYYIGIFPGASITLVHVCVLCFMRSSLFLYPVLWCEYLDRIMSWSANSNIL